MNEKKTTTIHIDTDTRVGGNILDAGWYTVELPADYDGPVTAEDILLDEQITIVAEPDSAAESWDEEGYQAACEAHAQRDRDGVGTIERMDRGSGADRWGEGLINGIGAGEAARVLGLTSLYGDGGVMTREAEDALDRYDKACTAGWNRFVDETSADDAEG